MTLDELVIKIVLDVTGFAKGQATDARGIAADIEPHLHRGQAAGRADYGLA